MPLFFPTDENDLNYGVLMNGNNPDPKPNSLLQQDRKNYIVNFVSLLQLILA